MVTELARDMETSGGRGLTLTARIGELSVGVDNTGPDWSKLIT